MTVFFFKYGFLIDHSLLQRRKGMMQRDVSSPVAQVVGVHDVAHDLGQAEARPPRHHALEHGATEADALQR